ncbi:MAG: ArsA family ATPase [Anaerolineales bacterium]
MRIIVHTGKGGVGKTSTSAATALRCAEMGLKTIVISTDTAHSLADSLDVELGPEPTQLQDNLWGQEIDARYSMEKYWGRVQGYFSEMMARRGVDEIVAEEVTILPGLEEGAHLLWINQYVMEDEFDVLIVDAAPTAETLRLLSLPDASRWWFNKIMSLTKGMGKMIRPFKSMTGIDIPDEEALDTVRGLFDTLDKVREILADPDRSTMRLVVNPERMVIRETQRTYTYLNLYGYVTDAVICNRIIPDAVTDPYFAAWKDLQKENLAYISEAFGELPLLKAPLFDKDIGGLDALRQLADALYADSNPAEIKYTGLTHRIEAAPDGGYVLSVPLPFADKRELDVMRSTDELTLRVGPYRRNIILPSTLWRMDIAEARFVEATLRIKFVNAGASAAS